MGTKMRSIELKKEADRRIAGVKKSKAQTKELNNQSKSGSQFQTPHGERVDGKTRVLLLCRDPKIRKSLWLRGELSRKGSSGANTRRGNVNGANLGRQKPNSTVASRKGGKPKQKGPNEKIFVWVKLTTIHLVRDKHTRAERK